MTQNDPKLQRNPQRGLRRDAAVVAYSGGGINIVNGAPHLRTIAWQKNSAKTRPATQKTL
jgi:hypothetical protein